MLYEDPTKDISSDERFHVELHFSPGVNCCVQKELPPGPGFRPHSRSNGGKSQFAERMAERATKDEADPIELSTPPPPLVCSIKCSKDSFVNVFEKQNCSDNILEESTTELSVDLDDLDLTPSSTGKMATSSAAVSDPIDIKVTGSNSIATDDDGGKVRTKWPPKYFSHETACHFLYFLLLIFLA